MSDLKRSKLYENSNRYFKNWRLEVQAKRTGQELSSTSTVYLLEDFDLQRTTVKGEILSLVKKQKLPALFEVDLKPIQKCQWKSTT